MATNDFDINHVLLRVIPQPDGSIGLKVEVETNRPGVLTTTLYPGTDHAEVIAQQTIDHTHTQFGAVVPAELLATRSEISLPRLEDPA